MLFDVYILPESERREVEYIFGTRGYPHITTKSIIVQILGAHPGQMLIIKEANVRHITNLKSQYHIVVE